MCLAKLKTIYHVLVRFFRNGDSALNRNPKSYIYRERHQIEGDLPGLKEQLPYLQSLGVDALWLSPLHPCRTTHGYDVEDFLDLDPYQVPGSRRLDRIAWFREFIGACHEHGIDVLMDLVMNHASHRFCGLPGARMVQAGNAQEREWSHTFQFFHKRCQRTEEALIEVGLFWLQVGADGFRLDYVLGRSKGFWYRFNQAMRQQNPNVLLLGEAWKAGRDALSEASQIYSYFQYYRKNSFEGLFDFAFQKTIRRALIGDTALQTLGAVLDMQTEALHQGFQPVVFLDNHDMRRLRDWPGMTPELFEAALMICMLHPGWICLEYGTEMGLLGQPGQGKIEESGRVAMPADDWSARVLPTFAKLQTFREQLQRSRSVKRSPAFSGRHVVEWELVLDDFTYGISLFTQPTQYRGPAFDCLLREIRIQPGDFLFAGGYLALNRTP